MSGGKKHRKKKRDFETIEASELIKREKNKNNKKYMILLAANTLLLASLYMYLVRISELAMIITLWAYLALAIGFSSAYIIYNRGLPRKNITRDMLSDSMTDAEKDEFIAESRQRLEKSKWMLTVIFPLVMTLCLDLFILFVVDPLFSGIGG